MRPFLKCLAVPATGSRSLRVARLIAGAAVGLCGAGLRGSAEEFHPLVDVPEVKLAELPGVRVPTAFTLSAPQARQVFLAGEMTNWEAHKVALTRGRDGAWTTPVDLQPGLWLYKFIVDGQWIADPTNPLSDNDGHGGRHSFLLVGDGDWAVPAGARRGEVRTFTLPAAGTKTHLYLPPGYKTGDRYPLLVLLHGSSMDADQWLKTGLVDRFMDSMIARGKIRPFLVVMPSSIGDDMYAGPSERAIMTELLPFLQKNYGASLSPSDTAVSGMSMGGSGAFTLACRHPDRFGLALPISGYFDGEVIGNLPRPVALRFQLQFRCGSNDRLVGGNRDLAAILRKAGVAFDYREGFGGHDFHYWCSVLPEALATASAFFAPGRER